MHKKLMAEINAKKKKIVKEVFGTKIYNEQKEAYLTKKREPSSPSALSISHCPACAVCC